ncbi:type II CAAX prenyl endopeptidase Rce1 family protein [Chloroflexota bacterium]
MEAMNTRVKKILPPIIPYITIGIGLLVFHNAWLAILGYHTGMVAVISLSKTGIAMKRAFQCNRYWIPFIAVLAGAGGGILLYILWPLLSVPDDINSYIRSIGLNERTWPVFLAYFILINPLIEEYYWRGYLASVTKGIVVNDLLFSGYHLIVLAGQMETIWLIAVFFGLTIGAWFWRQMNRLNGGLLASTISHITADIAVILTIYFISMN